MRKHVGGILSGFVAAIGLAGACGHEPYAPGRVCAAGEEEACYSGPAGTQDVGVCRAGTRTCDAGETAWGPCLGEITPGAETCVTPDDEDCDGEVNEEGEACACKPGSVEACYTGPGGTEGVGICGAGTRSCAASGTWGACNDQVVPGEEDCDSPLDEDCDGAACAAPIWAVRFGNADDQFPASIATDAEGNTLLAGAFSGAIDFGDGPVLSKGGADIFVAKLDPKGETIWSSFFGGAGTDHATSVAAGIDGDVVIAGAFSSSTLALDSAFLVNAGGYDAFVAKLDGQTGEAVWAAAIGHTGDQEATAVTVDAAGNTYAVGWFDGNLACVLAPDCTTSQGATDGFVAQLDSTGAVTWHVPFGGPANDRLNAIALDPAGNLAVAGRFAESATWGATTLQTSGPSDQDLFVAKLSPSKQVLWAKDFGDDKKQEATGLAIDAQANVAVIGNTAGVIPFPGGPPAIGDGGSRAFLLQLSAAGGPVWARAFGTGSGSAIAASVQCDGAGRLALAGSFIGTIDFGQGEQAAIGAADAFLVKLDAAGERRWSKTFGSAGVANTGNGVAFTPAGELRFAAAVRGTVDFGLGELSSAGKADVGAAAFAP